jgi:hypothetical protein
MAEVVPGKITENVTSLLEAGADPNSVDDWVRLLIKAFKFVFIFEWD